MATAADSNVAVPVAKSDSGSTTDKGDKTTATTGKDCNDTTTTTAKGGKDTTDTTDKGGKDSTTTTTRKGAKGGKGSTTTTTDRHKDDPTTPTTTQGGSVDPGGPSGSPSAGSGDSGSNIDNPVKPQNVPDDEFSDPGPAADPDAAADPGAGGDDSFDWSAGPIEPDGADQPAGPMAVPGAADSMLPVFGDLFPASGSKASAQSSRSVRPSGRVQELAAPPVLAPRVSSQTGMTESTALSRRLGGLQTSVTESAFPARIISTPSVFPVNHRDPLAAAAMVLLAGVSRELFKAWRRRASQYWPA
jgi:hypothetical protein